MAATSQTVEQPSTIQLRLASGEGPVTRTVLQTPPRDALPSETPVIDITRIFSSCLEDRQAVAREVHNAATSNGFFYISNHGVPEDVVKEVYHATLSYFRQDLDIKMASDTALSHGKKSGYRPSASQRVNPDEGADHRESFSWTYDPKYDPDICNINTVPEYARKHMRNDEFPWESTSHMPHFKEALVPYIQACLKLAKALTRTFALSLNVAEDYFDSKIKYPDSMMLLNYYPQKPPHAPTDPLKQVSLGSHTDFRLFTILWQDSTGGLQILNREGQWINARPVPNTFVVNIADFMQRITNDKYVSTVHRAHNWSGEERVSIPFFWGFGAQERCGVLDSCVGEGEEMRYEEIGTGEWTERRLRELLSWGREV
ncbi:hypothetical protein QQS21_009667 [Conoideocrella luteorostrata]|uniref:Fe2OG dioxygenase domain-containing protein n=1 Tax=Conoideocrella luteorostrata TaxID=1105319 RepID=A0AAJ0CGH5_9HYPO|nr:hypothetical protein QQS21_009667 [Conoideocrella luteorostrata]